MADRALGNPLGNPLGLPFKRQQPIPVDDDSIGLVKRTNFLEEGFLRLEGQVIDPTEKLREAIGENTARELMTQYPSPQVSNNSLMYCSCYSPEGGYFVAGGSAASAATSALVYRVSESTSFTQLPGVDTGLPAQARGVSLSGDGEYLAIAHQLGDGISIYKRNGDQFNKISSPDILPPGTVSYCCEFSADGSLLVVGSNSAPYLTIYSRSGDAFTKIPDPAVLPTGSVYGVSFSRDGKVFSASHGTAPFLSAYEVSGNDFSSISTPRLGSTGSTNYCDLSDDGLYLAQISSSTLRMYKRDAGAFLHVATWSAGNDPLNVSIRGDAEAVAWSTSAAVRIRVSEFNGLTLSDVPPPSPVPSYETSSVLFSPNGRTVVAVSSAIGTTTKIRLYGTDRIVLPNVPGYVMRVAE